MTFYISYTHNWCTKISKSDFLYYYVMKVMIKYTKIKKLDNKIYKMLKVKW